MDIKPKTKLNSSSKLRKVNNVLNIFLLLLAVYVLLWPFLPLINMHIKKFFDKTDGYVYQTSLSSDPDQKPIPKDNRLVIPGIQVDQPVKEGSWLGVINKDGVWRLPKTSSPNLGGNTVIVGHRFSYQGSAAFYNLDKIKAGDDIIVYWEGKEYAYRVGEVKTVKRSAGEIEAPTSDTRLTLYTCTPLLTGKDRLVVTAWPLAGDQQ